VEPSLQLLASTERTATTKLPFVSSLGDQTRPNVLESLPLEPGTPPKVSAVSVLLEAKSRSWRLVKFEPLSHERLTPRSQSLSVTFATAETRIPVTIEPVGIAGMLKDE